MRNKLYYWQNTDDLKRIIHALDAQQVLITSTDTVFGFLAKPSSAMHEVINRLKKRSDDKPLLLLISTPDLISSYVDQTTITNNVRRLLAQAWPGPVTFIFKAALDVPAHLVSVDKNIALRCPGHDGLRRLLESFPALLSTSANTAGAPTPKTKNDIEPDLLSRATALVLDLPGAVAPSSGLGSTIIDLSMMRCTNSNHQNGPHSCDETGTPRVVRAGAFPVGQLESYFGSPFEKEG